MSQVATEFSAETVTSLKKNPPSKNYDQILLSILIFMLLIAATRSFLYNQSYKAVPHQLHAVQYAPNKFIHGSFLECDPGERSTICEVEIDGKLLTIRTFQVPPIPLDDLHTIGRCSAQFDSRHVDCGPDYSTSSYWAHGVIVENAELTAAMSKGGPMFSWQGFLLGMGEGAALLGVWGLAVVIPLLSHVTAAVIRRGFWGPRNRALLRFDLNALSLLAVMCLITFTTFILLAFGYGFAD